jgi:hypothetical protein
MRCAALTARRNPIRRELHIFTLPRHHPFFILHPDPLHVVNELQDPPVALPDGRQGLPLGKKGGMLR